MDTTAARMRLVQRLALLLLLSVALADQASVPSGQNTNSGNGPVLQQGKENSRLGGSLNGRLKRSDGARVDRRSRQVKPLPPTTHGLIYQPHNIYYQPNSHNYQQNSHNYPPNSYNYRTNINEISGVRASRHRGRSRTFRRYPISSYYQPENFYYQPNSNNNQSNSHNYAPNGHNHQLPNKQTSRLRGSHRPARNRTLKPFPRRSYYQPHTFYYQPNSYNYQPNSHNYPPNGYNYQSSINKISGLPASHYPRNSNNQSESFFYQPNSYNNQRNSFNYQPDIYRYQPNSLNNQTTIKQAKQTMNQTVSGHRASHNPAEGKFLPLSTNSSSYQPHTVYYQPNSYNNQQNSHNYEPNNY